MPDNHGERFMEENNKNDDIIETKVEPNVPTAPYEVENFHATDEDLSFKQTYDKASAAVAISYDEDKKSPFVSALGYESRADAIVEMARELGLYVHKDPVLFNQLKNLKEGEEIHKDL